MIINNILKEEEMIKDLIKPFVISIALLLTFTACGDDDSVSPNPGKARVMAIHAAPNAPGIDVYVDNKLVQSNLTFPNNTQYIEVLAGLRSIKVNVAGTAITVFDQTIPFAENKNYSAFATDSSGTLDALLLEDNLTAPASGKAHVRFIHLSSNAPAVDVVADGEVILSNVSFKDVINFTAFDAGTYSVQVREAGTANVVLNVGNITLTGGKIYTVFARGLVGGVGTQALGVSVIENN